MFTRATAARAAPTPAGGAGPARHLGERCARGSGTCSSTSMARGDVELAVGEGQVLGLHRPVLEVGRPALLPLGRPARVLEVDADDARGRRARSAQRWVSTPSPQPTSSSEAGSAGAKSSLSVALEAAMQAADRPGWWSRTCRRCCRSGPARRRRRWRRRSYAAAPRARRCPSRRLSARRAAGPGRATPAPALALGGACAGGGRTPVGRAPGS